MIIVTGTKRSGTSMWMQILRAAGFDVIGAAFPKNWESTLRDANPHGFYESALRSGIREQGQGPISERKLEPETSTHVAAKVFVPGLYRTSEQWLSQVVVTMRHWREYVASIERLYAMESEANAGETRHHLDPVLEWWLENFALIRDIVVRQYPVYGISYERVVRDSDSSLPPILRWLGADDADAIDAAVATVSPTTQTQTRSVEGFHEHAPMFDELYQAVHDGHVLDRDFIQRLNYTHQQLLPDITDSLRRGAGSAFVRRMIPTVERDGIQLRP